MSETKPLSLDAILKVQTELNDKNFTVNNKTFKLSTIGEKPYTQKAWKIDDKSIQEEKSYKFKHFNITGTGTDNLVSIDEVKYFLDYFRGKDFQIPNTQALLSDVVRFLLVKDITLQYAKLRLLDIANKAKTYADKIKSLQEEISESGTQNISKINDLNKRILEAEKMYKDYEGIIEFMVNHHSNKENELYTALTEKYNESDEPGI